MRILFLDDMEARHRVFDQCAIGTGHEIHHAYDAEDAIRKMEARDYDAASLDCDLADEHYDGMYVSPANGGTAHSGRAVARYIADHARHMQVLVHSFNPDGATHMTRTLGDAGVKVVRAPFGPVACSAWLEGLA